MNKLVRSALAADPDKQQPFPQPSREFIQNAYKEALSHIVQNIVNDAYDPTKMYVLWGCVNSGLGSTFTISAGAVFFNGEIYTVPSASFIAGGGQTAVAKITVTNPAPDPILLKDGTPTSVHNVRQVVIASAVSGTGDADFLDFIRVNQIPINAIMIANPSQASTVSDVLLAGMTYTTPDDGITRKWDITYKGIAVTALNGASTQTGATATLKNVTASTILDTNIFILEGAIVASAIVGGAVLLKALVSLPPNTTIQVSIQSHGTGGSAGFSVNKLIMQELRVN